MPAELLQETVERDPMWNIFRFDSRLKLVLSKSARAFCGQAFVALMSFLAWGALASMTHSQESTDISAQKSASAPASLAESVEFLRSINDYLAVVREQMSDKAFSLDRRESIASETLGMLRFRISEAPTPQDSLKVWSILIDTAEVFSNQNPNHPMSERFQLTIAEAWWQRSRLVSRIASASQPQKPGDLAKPDRDQAIAILEKQVGKNGPANDASSQMSRYLLAQCLADQIVANGGKSDQNPLRHRILKLTENLDSESLQDWAYLMRARAFGELGQTSESLGELEKTSEAFRHRNTSAWAEVKVSLLVLAKKWEEADQFLKSTDLPASLTARLEVELWSARWQEPLEENQKNQLRETVFKALEKVQDKSDPDAVLARLYLSRSGIEPPSGSSSQWWKLLSVCHLLNGQTKNAALALDRAVAQARTENNHRQLLEYMFQSGAAWYRAGEANQAQARMLEVVNDPDAGELGPKASLLRVLSLKSLGLSGKVALGEAIATHLEKFEKDLLSTGEVRWIDGQLLASQGQRDAAIIAFSAIMPDHPRWLPSLIAISKLDLEYLENLAVVADNRAFAKRWESARKRLEQGRDSAPTPQDKATIELAIARLDLTPGSDRADAARQATLRLQPKLTRDSQRQWASAILIMADALSGRSLDLESRLNGRDAKMDDALVLDMCRVLDTQASIIDTEGVRRQLGGAMARLAESLPANDLNLPPEVNSELELRKIRGLIYAGQASVAEPRLDAWLKAHPDVSPSLLFAVSDALLRLNATAKAINYLSVWVGQEPEGEIPWFLGRLELAKALYREGRDKESSRLIEATLVLYPEAGGAGLKRKYESLRRSIKD